MKKLLGISTFAFLILSLLTFTLPDKPGKEFLMKKGIYSEQNRTGNVFEENELNEEIQGPDKPDKALLYEFKATQDPATKTVPRERLLNAINITNQLKGSDNAIPMTWQERGPSNIGGRTRAILVDLRDTTGNSIWLAGVGGGLWRSTNMNASNPTYTSVNDFFNNLAVTTIAQNPSNPNEIYFGTGEGWHNLDAIRGAGIWKSTNGGLNFTQLPSTSNVTSFAHVQKLIFHPLTGHLYAATRGRDYEVPPGTPADTAGGVFRSTDGGTTWTQVLSKGNGSVSPRAADIEISSNGSIYATMGIVQTDGIYKSRTGNPGSWTKLNTITSGFPTTGFHRIEIEIAPNNSSMMYAAAQNSVTFGILGVYKSIDSGATWVSLPLPTDSDPQIGPDYTRMQAWYDLPVECDPNNANVVYVGGIDLFKTTTGGAGWQQISHWYGLAPHQYVHADQHAIVFRPGNSNIIYFGNDGGIWRSNDGTATIPTIKGKNSGYDVTQYYGCDIHPGASVTHFLAGAQDNGSHKFTSAGINVTPEVSGGDGCLPHIDQNEPQFQWTSYVYNNYYRSTDGGNSFTAVSFSDDGQFVNPTDYDDVSNKLYGAKTNGTYFRWDDPQTGATASTVTVTAFDTNLVTAVTVSPNTPNRVFFGLETGRIVRVDSAQTGTTKAGVNITSNLTRAAGLYPFCIAVQPGNDNHLMLVYANYGWNSVWESTNGGTNWTSVEGNLPDMPVRWALFSPNNNTQAIIGTETGVWTTDLLNGGSTFWAPSTNFPNVATYMIKYRTSDKFMIAATHGRGLYSTDAFTTARVDFGTNKRVTYTGKAVQFTDNSYQATSWNWNFGDGQTSTQQNPSHAYSAQGTYTISLTINGNLTATKTNYITVLPYKGTPYTPADGGNFEVNNGQFAPENISGTPWQRGKSNIPNKDSAHSGTNAWVTGINDTLYQNSTEAILYCPNYKFTAAGTYTIKFWGKFSTEAGWDGFRVEYSTDKGDTWTYIGGISPTWYNFPNSVQNTVFPANEPYFSGPQPFYKQYSADASSLAGQNNVAFRFVFKSDANTQDNGVAIDDWEVAGPPNGVTETGNNLTGIPQKYELSQNFPNPFNPVTKINFAIPKQGLVTLKIYDITGREVATLINEIRNAGFYSADFNGENFASGVYFYKLKVNEFTDVKRMVLVK
jgi:PKD repeat protein